MKNNPSHETKNYYNNERILTSFVFCFVLIFMDQASKYFIFLQAKNFLFILPFKNYNFAFSLPVPITAMYLIYFLIILFILSYFFRHFDKFSQREMYAWLFIISGAFANIGERLVLGYVRDFILVLNGIFNFADFYIIIGIVALLIETRSRKQELKNSVH